MQDLLSSRALPKKKPHKAENPADHIPLVTLFLQVQYSDAQSGKDFVTYLTLSPVQMTFHGTGSTLQASHDQVFVSVWFYAKDPRVDVTPVECLLT